MVVCDWVILNNIPYKSNSAALESAGLAVIGSRIRNMTAIVCSDIVKWHKGRGGVFGGQIRPSPYLSPKGRRVLNWLQPSYAAIEHLSAVLYKKERGEGGGKKVLPFPFLFCLLLSVHMQNHQSSTFLSSLSLCGFMLLKALKISLLCMIIMKWML